MAWLCSDIVLYLTSTIVILCSLIYLYFKRAHSYWERLGVPNPKPRFLYGNIYDAIALKTTFGESIDNFYKSARKNGQKYIGLYMFQKPSFLPIHPDIVKNIMTRDFQHFHDRGVYYDEENDPLSAHLFSLNGLKWKNLRAKLSPTFTSGKLKQMFQILVDCSQELKGCLNESIKKKEAIDIHQVSAQYTTDVIGSCIFGINCNSFKNPNCEFIQVGKLVLDPNWVDRTKLFLSIAFPKLIKLLNIRLTNKKVDEFYRNLVTDTINYRETNNIARNDFMQLLIQLKNKGTVDDDEGENVSNEVGKTLTLNEACAQAFLFFLAGYETSSTTMTFCLLELAQNQEIQDKCREEIVRILKKHDGNMTYESLTEMRYMERTIQETLRKHPPLMLLQRMVTSDYLIQEAGSNITLKKNLTVLIPVYSLHNDPEYYPDPEKFDPDRFTEEAKKTRPDYTYLPFGEGPRNCIGLRLGMMQTKVGLCQILLNYKFTINSKTKFPVKYEPVAPISKIKGGVWLNAEKVED